ncbi:DrmB family protein, partial [Paenarthrobacter nitroguajacolicus]|uniref:DrmB family protein n=1 Tax=Paenarthrobacter nitroguajacolicus TaxID=211146 RepID=UPI003ADD3322
PPWAIHLEKNQLSQLVLDGWEHFADVEDEAELRGIVKTLIRTSALPGIDKWDVPSIWQAIEHRKAGKGIELVSEGDIKGPEWEVLTSSSPPSDWPHFMSTAVNPPVGYEAQVKRVLLLERLREVNALIGYTRIEAPEETSDPDERPPMAALTRGTTEWVLASEVHGEGIFIEFNESAIKSWEQNPHVADRDKTLFVGHEGWRNARHLKPDVGFPPSRYTMLHTIAHLLVRELALECGYNAASIRERVYASSDPEAPMAGILLYTAAADSDGTLGGLVDLGKPDFLGRLLDQALERASICSSDPLCSEHDPSKDRSLHAAACHSCTFVSETSCERGNRYLDRALVIPTLRDDQSCLFHKGSS